MKSDHRIIHGDAIEVLRTLDAAYIRMAERRIRESAPLFIGREAAP